MTIIIMLPNEINFLCNACEWKEKKNEGNNEKMQENNKIVHKVKCIKSNLNSFCSVSDTNW